MNSGGCRYLPPLLQTKHNFRAQICGCCRGVHGVGGGTAPGNAGAAARLLPRNPALCSLCLQVPAALGFRGGCSFCQTLRGFRRNPSTQINYCYLYLLGLGPPACLLRPECAQLLSPLLSFLFFLFFFSPLFTSALICILSSVQRPLK